MRMIQSGPVGTVQAWLLVIVAGAYVFGMHYGWFE